MSKRNFCVMVVLGLGLAGLQTARASNITVYNNSFEMPDASGYGFAYDPTIADQGGAGWDFTTGGAYVLNQSAGLTAPGAIPDGSQVGALQIFWNDNTGDEISISQLLTGFTVGDQYEVSFYMGTRSDVPGLMFDVQFDGHTIDSETPASSTFTYVTTSAYTATASNMDLKFVNASGPPSMSSNTELDSLIDQVTVTDIGPAAATPEPAGTVLLLTGLAALAVWKRRAAHARD